MFQRYHSFTSKTHRMCTARTRQAYSLSAKMSSRASNLACVGRKKISSEELCLMVGLTRASQPPRVNNPHTLLTLCNSEGCSVQLARKESDRKIKKKRLGSPLNEIDSVAWPLLDVQSKSWAETDSEAWRPAPAACSTAQ